MSHRHTLHASFAFGLAAILWAAPAPAQTTFMDDYVPQPAYAGQTRAPLATQHPRLVITTVATGLFRAWGFEFLPDGRMLVTERPGRIRIITPEGAVSDPIAGLPPIRAYSGNGLRDVELDPNFAENRLIYLAYMAALPGDPGDSTDEAYAEWTERYENSGETRAERAQTSYGNRTVARARLSEDETSLEDVKVLLVAPVQRFTFHPDGTLLMTTPLGGREDNPQRLESPNGKVLRINTDGSIPEDNPWVDDPDAIPALYARGFRDPQGIQVHPDTGDLWTIENGPRGGDELNIVRSGRNYGWPVISYGRNYNTQPIGDGITSLEGMEQPVYFWSPSIAPSDFTFYTGEMFPEWEGNILVAAMVGEHLSRLVLVGDRIVGEERILHGREQRIKDVRVDAAGAIYVLTDADDGQLLRLTPQRDLEPAS